MDGFISELGYDFVYKCMFQIDQRCSSDFLELKLDNSHQELLFHCTCPGCTMSFYLTIIFFLFLLILVCFVTMYLKTKPYAEYYQDYQHSRQYDRVQDTAL